MRTLLAASLIALPLAAGCASSELLYEGETVKSEDGKDDASSVALFLDFRFQGELLTNSSWNPNGKIEDQLLYTIGQLNGDNSIGRLDKLVLTDVSSEREGDLYRVSYTATMPVAWGDKNDVPDSYTFKLPHDVSYDGKQRFTDAYSHDCVDWGAHDVTPGSMWYYYRPAAYRCELEAGDIVEVEAAVSVSDINTTGKFPEYDKIWSDDKLEVVAVFGKYEDGATTSSDAGIAAYNKFVAEMKRALAGRELVTVPAEVPTSPGVEVPEVTFTAQLDGGKSVEVVALMVDNVRTAGAEFDRRYEALSTRADLIIYNGHAGLGANIRALARKGNWVAGQYAVMFINGCDTYAYVDSALLDAHAAVNPDDPIGTKYVDIVTNAMPSFFRSMAGASMALVRGLMSYDEPQTYEQIFRSIDRSQVVLVSGEEDNTYVPGGGGGPDVPDWSGLSDSGTVSRGQEHRWQTPTLPAGSYVFEITGTDDADLYVRIGSAPTERVFDCRPFKTGSNETCKVELTSPAALHVMVRGWASSSEWNLEGRRQ